jgi:hypothetical protein
VILWGHATHLAFGFDARDALTKHALQIPGLNRGLARALPLTADDEARPFDLLGFDACGLSTIETAYELRNSARYMLASEIGMPLPGWPYSDVLQTIAANPDISPEELGPQIVRCFSDAYPEKPVAFSMLDLRAASANGLPAAMKELAVAVALVVGTDADRRAKVIELFRDARLPTNEPLVDVAQLCDGLAQAHIDNRVDAAAAAVRPLLDNGSGLVVDTRRHGEGAENLSGVSVYAPHVGRPVDPWLNVYDELALSRETVIWPKLVRFLLLADSVGA